MAQPIKQSKHDLAMTVFAERDTNATLTARVAELEAALRDCVREMEMVTPMSSMDNEFHIVRANARAALARIASQSEGLAKVQS